MFGEVLEKDSNEILDESFVDDIYDLDSVDDLREEISENSELFEEWKNLIYEILPDLDEVFVDSCLDELKRLRLFYGFVWDSNQIRRILLQANMAFWEQYKDAWQESDPSLFIEFFEKQILAGVLDLTDYNYRHLILSDEEQLSMLMYLAQHFDELEEEEKKKFLAWFEDLLAWYKEYKVLEVYEVSIAEDGTVVIKAVRDWKHVRIHWHPDLQQFQVQVGKANVEDIKKIGKDLELLKPFAGAEGVDELPEELQPRFFRRRKKQKLKKKMKGDNSPLAGSWGSA